MIALLITFAALALLRAAARAQRKVPVYAVQDLDRQRKESEKADREAVKARAKAEREAAQRRKAVEERAQALEDIPYWENRLEQLYEQIEDASSLLQTARRTCRHDAEMNQHGAVIAEKIVAKHIAERDKLMRKVMMLESQIHAAEMKLNKARFIAQH